MKRYALVSLKRDSAEVVSRYLPANYKVIGTVDQADATDKFDFTYGPVAIIKGEDNAGWTLDDYVIPRLGSGLIVAREIDLSHPVMKKIPV
jgi:hypothetical protein